MSSSGYILNPSDVVQPNYWQAGTTVCRSAGSDAPVDDFNGGSSNGFGVSPNSTVEAPWIMLPDNANTNLNINKSNVVYTGRKLFIFDTAWFQSVPTTTYNILSVTCRDDEDGGFSSPYFQRVVNVGPGLQAVMLGRTIDASTNVGVASWGAGAGSPSWDTAQRGARFTIGALDINPATPINKLWLMQMLDNIIARPNIIVSCDDAHVSVYDHIWPLYRDRGLKIVIPIISDNIGTANYCTEANLDEMYATGLVRFANHTQSHTPDVYLNSRTYWDDQIGNCHEWIASRYHTPTSMYYPYGDGLRVTATDYRAAVEAVYDETWGTTDANLAPILPSKLYLPRHNCRTFSGGVNMAGHVARLQSVVWAGASTNIMLHQATTGAVSQDVQLTVADHTTLANAIAQWVHSGFANSTFDTEYARNAYMGSAIWAAA